MTIATSLVDAYGDICNNHERNNAHEETQTMDHIASELEKCEKPFLVAMKELLAAVEEFERRVQSK